MNLDGRSVPEWVGKTPDSRIPPAVQARVFLRFKGVCPECTRKLVPGQWQCDHIKALINGGENRERNLQPLCTSPCHSNKTKADVAEKSRVASKRAKHLGIKRPRTIRAWRKFDGTPVYATKER
jgi:5-methylcytosine-specific restriction protein A